MNSLNRKVSLPSRAEREMPTCDCHNAFEALLKEDGFQKLVTIDLSWVLKKNTEKQKRCYPQSSIK